MNIGGVDVVLRVKDPTVPFADIILHAARWLWPGFVFQDADQSQIFENNDPKLWLYRTVSREFFLYRDADAATAWNDAGGTPENQLTMVHCLIADGAAGTKSPRELTVVVGELTEQMTHFIDALRPALNLRIVRKDPIAA